MKKKKMMKKKMKGMTRKMMRINLTPLQLKVTLRVRKYLKALCRMKMNRKLTRKTGKT